ncbi:MAG TPA: phosphodiester glycosidase family protein [Dermatophilaceae bacterium]
MTTRTDIQIDTPQKHRQPPRPGVSRPSRRRIWLRRAGVVILVPLLWLGWSIGGALTAPGTDTTAARLAEWARFNGMGWVVSELEQIQYQLNPPKVGGSLAGGIPMVSAPQMASGPSTRTSRAMPNIAVPAPIPPQTQPALPNEGVWQTLTSVRGQPAIRAAFLRPDAQHTSYLVGVAWLNQKLVKMVLHPGYRVPGGSGWSQAFDVPSSQRDRLLATFNSGFTMQDANGGYWQDGQSAVPLRQGAASMVLYKDGHVDVVKWNAATPGPDVAAVRQNLGLLVENGAISPDVNSRTTRTWGKTVGDTTFVWRSALGVRKDGSLVFVVGASMSVPTLAKIVHDAGAVTAMELDINKAWTNFITYTHPSSGVAAPHMLTRDEHPNPYRYLQLSSRDFVAVFPR